MCVFACIFVDFMCVCLCVCVRLSIDFTASEQLSVCVCLSVYMCVCVDTVGVCVCGCVINMHPYCSATSFAMDDRKSFVVYSLNSVFFL